MGNGEWGIGHWALGISYSFSPCSPASSPLPTALNINLD
ncbi:hypothetical protein COO91_04759 [Nostoc flagelliforme CCNUN1]|uniref:Uncharacterized protein n=1 Tax=Nostoc flagelliforme CCNUN1 TaxID=2038116 RepID=A0A2K8STI5_9NOSO|nr:hypothetical protein COO91_04759 [Nostoc flagelliforme CCNUN1]